MIAQKIKQVLTNPKTILLGVGLGILSGIYFKPQAVALKPFSDLYVALLSMCMLPIMVSALVWGIGQMLRNPKTRRIFPRMATVYGVGLLIPAVVAVAVALVFQPGAQLGDAAADLLGGQILGAERAQESGGLFSFFFGIIPPNVFEALSKGQFINIVFFAVLAGLALGVVRTKGADQTLEIVHTLYEMFSTIFSWVLSPLPFGLFSVVAANIGGAATELLYALLAYLGFFSLAAVIVFIIYIVILAIATGKRLWQPLVELKTPLILAFATDNPFVALYSSIEALRLHFDVDEEVANTVAPFGVIANQHGQILLFAFTTIFLAQIYGIELGVMTLVTIVLGSVIAGAAAVGGGPVIGPVMAPILLGAGVPYVLAPVILATTQPLIASLVSTLTVQATCTVAVLSGKSRFGRAKATADAPLAENVRDT